MHGDLCSCERSFVFLLKSRFVIKVGEILPCPPERYFLLFLLLFFSLFLSLFNFFFMYASPVNEDLK